jgi:hypothetical protein
MNIFEALERDWHHAAAWFEPHTHPSPTITTSDPPAQPAQETTMATHLADLIAQAKDSADQGTEWLRQISETHLPAILAEAERLQANPIVQALEGVVLPPAAEAHIASSIGLFAALLPAQAAVAAPAAPEAPAASAEQQTAA